MRPTLIVAVQLMEASTEMRRWIHLHFQSPCYDLPRASRRRVRINYSSKLFDYVVLLKNKDKQGSLKSLYV